MVVLTNIALEHTEVLGDTRELIFAEKAAVIKGGDAVFGELDGLEDEARRVCSAAGAAPHFLRDSAWPGDLAVSGSPDDFAVTFAPAGRLERWAGLRVPTPALYQVQNAALAVAAVRLLLGSLDEAAVRQALAGTAVPGRLQVVAERPLVLADGAHNPDGVRVLAQSLAAVRVPRPAVGVLAIMRDKDYPAMLEGFLPLLDGVVCTQASEPRSLQRRGARDGRPGGCGERTRAAAAGRGRRPTRTTRSPGPAISQARAAASSWAGRCTCSRTCGTWSPGAAEARLPVLAFGYTGANPWRGEWLSRRLIPSCASWSRSSS